MRGIAAACFLNLVAFAAQAADLTPSVQRMAEPMAPFKIADNLYYVGASDATAFLVDGGAGNLILTDGTFAQTAPMVEANIKALGFDPKNVKVLLNSHAHFDHAAGLAYLKAATGAKLHSNPMEIPALADGGKSAIATETYGPQGLYEPVQADEHLNDGQKITVGKATLTIHFTPGHTIGCTSWSMKTQVAGKPVDVLMNCSLTVHPVYRLVQNPSYPGIADDFRNSVKNLRALPCDIPLGSHGIFFDLKAKAAKLQAGAADAFVDPQGCRAYIETSAKLIDAAIAKERAQ